MVAGAVLGTAGRLALVAAALSVGRGEAAVAAVTGAIAAALFVAQRFALTAARVGAECDLYRAAARALVDTDVLEVPDKDLQRVVFETNHQGRALIATTIPTLLADAVVLFAAVPILFTVLPLRVLALAAAGLTVVLSSLLAVRRITKRLQDRLVEATQLVTDAVLIAVDGRLELVARGGDVEFVRALNVKLARYASVATRSSLGSALLGRAPLLLGAAAIGAVALLDGATRAALGAAVLSQALVLAAVMPVVFGLVLGAGELVRAGPVLAPLVELLDAARRPELAAAGATPPLLPAVIAFEDVSFAYDDESPPALRNVAVEWVPGLPLVVVEAMLCGRLCIVTDVAGNAELMEDGISGFVAPAHTPDLLDQALERAWQRREEWSEIGRQASLAVRRHIPRDPVGAFADDLVSLCGQ